MRTSQELFAAALKLSPGGVQSPVRALKSLGIPPVFFSKAQGAHLVSVEGKSYLDFCQSFGPMILGHRDPEILEVVHRAVDTAWSFGTVEPYSLELAEFIVENIPWVEKIRFVSSGTEATMTALRLARGFTGRNLIVKFDGCYHGHADGLLVKAGSGLAGDSAQDSAGITPLQASETLVLKLDDEKALEDLFARRGKEIAAIIIEPLPANYGLLIQREEFLRKVGDVAHKYGSLLILDEVISGFRVAMGGMAELLKLTPDLVCYGKVLGGGFPVGAYGGRLEIMDLIAPAGPVYQAGTLSANPVGMMAGLATLKKLERDHVFETIEKRTHDFSETINTHFQKNNSGVQITTFGSIFWLHLAAGDIRSPDQIPKANGEFYKLFFAKCLEKNIYLPPSPYEVGFVGLAHTESLLEEAAEILCSSVVRS